MERRFFFENSKQADARKEFRNAVNNIDPIEKEASSFDDFSKKVIHMFSEHNFSLVHH